MFTQITIIKTDDDTFKVTFFGETGVLYAEFINDISEIIAMCRPSLENMILDPRSAYAQTTKTNPSIPPLDP